MLRGSLNMQRIFIYISFIPWILYYTYNTNSWINTLQNSKINMNWFKKNFFRYFSLSEIVLYLVFFYFTIKYNSSKEIFIVTTILFFLINLYLLVRKLELSKKYSQTNRHSLLIYFILILITLLPFTYYVFSNNYTVTYYILLFYSLFAFALIIFIKLLLDFMKNNGFKL